MKVSFDRNGVITIEALIPVEMYALRRWCEENIVNGIIDMENICFVYGYLPEEKTGEQEDI